MKELEKPQDAGTDQSSPLTFKVDEKGRAFPAVDTMDTEAIDCFARQIANTFGVKSQVLATVLSDQAVGASKGCGIPDAGLIQEIMGVVHEFSPGDPMEAMLIVQMITVHNQSMAMLKKSTRFDHYDSKRRYLDLSMRLFRTYTAQMEALRKHRQKGRQKMIVEHVHIHPGGHAMVGNIEMKKGEGV